MFLLPPVCDRGHDIAASTTLSRARGRRFPPSPLSRARLALGESYDIGEIVMTEIFAVGVEYVGVAAEEVVDVAYPFAVGRGDDTEPSSCLFKVDVGHLDVGGLEIYHCIWS